MRTDQPYAADGLALSERTGDRDELRQRLSRLPPGHPSSPVEADGTPRPPERGLGSGREANDAADRQPLTDAEHADHVTQVKERLDKARADGLATDRQHTHRSGPRGLGRSSATRSTTRSSTDLYARGHDVPCERRAIMAGGLPGAGKSTVLEHHAGIDRSQYLTINPDDIKEEMARRDMIPEVAGLTPMEASDLVHEESSLRSEAARSPGQARRQERDLGHHHVVTRIHREADRRPAIQLATTRIEGIFVDIPVESA